MFAILISLAIQHDIRLLLKNYKYVDWSPAAKKKILTLDYKSICDLPEPKIFKLKASQGPIPKAKIIVPTPNIDRINPDI